RASDGSGSRRTGSARAAGGWHAATRPLKRARLRRHLEATLPRFRVIPLPEVACDDADQIGYGPYAIDVALGHDDAEDALEIDHELQQVERIDREVVAERHVWTEKRRAHTEPIVEDGVDGRRDDRD